MKDNNFPTGVSSLDWGVRPLPKSERAGTRQGVSAVQQPIPTKPPAGGSAVPPAPKITPSSNSPGKGRGEN
jgi:hypothetical protein